MWDVEAESQGEDSRERKSPPHSALNSTLKFNFRKRKTATLYF